jgi:hypothetical protein
MLGMMSFSQVLRPVATFSWMNVDQVWTIFSGGARERAQIYLVNMVTINTTINTINSRKGLS